MSPDRTFTGLDAERTDDLGFVDLDRSPRVYRHPDLLAGPAVWVVGRPWIGKTTFAKGLLRHLRTDADAIPNLNGRLTLTSLGVPEPAFPSPPSWWAPWAAVPEPSPAVWLIDGVDEAIGHRTRELDMILDALASIPARHLGVLKLLVFSRPYDELTEFRDRVHELYRPVIPNGRLPQFWLTRMDRAAARALVGAGRFEAVTEVIRRNGLQSVAGYPVVLNLLKAYHQDTAGLTVPGVWRAVLTGLLGEPHSNTAVRFMTEPAERLAAAERMAAVLTLARRDSVREYSPDPGAPTLVALSQAVDNRLHAAARDACRSAVFQPVHRAGDPPEYRFAQRNVQDWLTAFALADLPQPALRSAITGPDGTVPPRLREVVRLLRVISTDPAVQEFIDRLAGDILPSDAAEPSLANVLRSLDRLEAFAQESPWGVRGGEDLNRLRVDGLDRELIARLRDPARPPRVKRLLLDVAEAVHAADVADVAVDLVLDRSQADELRYSAVWAIVRLGGNEHLTRLAGPIGEGGDDAEIERRLRGILLSELLARGLWPCWRAALHAPAVNWDLLDLRGMVLTRIERAMTLTDARRLLAHLQVLWRRHADPHRPHVLPDFLNQAVTLVLEASPPDPADLNELVQFVMATEVGHMTWPAARRMAIRLRPFAAARRALYARDVESPSASRLQMWNLLDASDWPWLRDHATGKWRDYPEVWSTAYWLGLRATREGLLADAVWQDFLGHVDVCARGLRADAEAAERRHQLEQAEEAERQREADANAVQTLSLQDQLRELLARPQLSPTHLMQALGLACSEAGRWDRRLNDWGDLPTDLQNRVVQAFVHGLTVAQPTLIPAENTFPAVILGEGFAFARVIETPGAREWVTGELIRRWLPTALFGGMSGEWERLLTGCHALSPAATAAALVDDLEATARRETGATLLRQIPPVCWTDALSDRMLALVLDDTFPISARGELLEQLGRRSPDRARPTAEVWAGRALSTAEVDRLRQAGRNTLLILDPDAVLGMIEAEFDARGRSALEELSVLWNESEGGGFRWTAMSLSHLERLGAALIRAFPPSADSESQSHWMTPADELRQIGDRIVGFLLERDEGDTAAALDRLGAIASDVRERIVAMRARRQAAGVLAAFDPAAGRDPSGISVRDAGRLLDRTGFRLIRTADDLLDALIEALRAINASVGHDLAMLYSAPDRTSGKGMTRKHLEEDALQAYLRRRLLDELARLAEGVDVQIVREDEIAARQRLDLRVTAPCRTGGLATVVIEVKWSTNPETRSGLVDQLAVRYLLGEQKTHGVFVVGWSGEWRPGDGTGANTDPNSLTTHLTTQRDDFCAAGQPGAGLRIEPCVLDLRWTRS